MSETRITLYAPAPAWNVPCIVPAGLKLETWLRMAGLSYDVAPPDLSIAPKGKLPFVRIDGELVGDSTFIIERLTHRFGKDLDAGLTPRERAISLAFRRMVKENLYWVLIHERWAIENNFTRYEPVLVQLFLAPLPAEVQKQACAEIRKQMLEQLHAHGMGRHRPEEIERIGIADLQAISDYLEEKPFFMGDRPTLVDATLFGYLVNLIDVPIASAVRDFGRATPNLLDYCNRVRERFFPNQ